MSDLGRRPDFQRLEEDIDTFAFSTISSDPAKSSLLAVVIPLPFIARILLHEPISTAVEGDKSMMISLNAAHRISQQTKQMMGTLSAYLDVLPLLEFVRPSISLDRSVEADRTTPKGWAVAGRTLLRAVAVQELWNDGRDTSSLRRQAEDIIEIIESDSTMHSSKVIRHAHSILRLTTQRGFCRQLRRGAERVPPESRCASPLIRPSLSNHFITTRTQLCLPTFQPAHNVRLTSSVFDSSVEQSIHSSSLALLTAERMTMNSM
jgi:hypothetical protein